MTRRVAALVLVVLAFFATPGQAVVPGGPRLAVVAHNARYGSELITIGPAGEAPQSLIGGARSGTLASGDRPSWSADGSLLALRVSRFGDRGSVLSAVKADGSGLRPYPRAPLEASDPVMAPDGRSVAFSRAKLVKVLPGRENYLFKSAVWLLDLEDGSLRRLTRWRLGTYLSPSSFSPDGSKLAATLFTWQGFKAVAIDLHSGDFSLLAREALEPTYSPDGSRFAFVRYLNWRLNGIDERMPAVDELRVGRVGSVTGSKLLLRKRGFFSWPSWDPSGSRLSFTHSPAYEIGDRSPHEGNRVLAINPDGTCLTKVFSDPDLTLFGSAWQPGSGREAGPISC